MVYWHFVQIVLNAENMLTLDSSSLAIVLFKWGFALYGVRFLPLFIPRLFILALPLSFLFGTLFTLPITSNTTKLFFPNFARSTRVRLLEPSKVWPSVLTVKFASHLLLSKNSG